MKERTGKAREHPLLTIPELADLVGMHPSTLYRAITRGDFPVPIVRFGDRIRVPRAAVEKLLYGEDTRAARPGSSDGDEDSRATRRRRVACSARCSWPGTARF